MVRGQLPVATRPKQRGAAIMLALWALFLLSAMVISWALDMGSRLSLSAQASHALEATAMACSGAEVAFAVVAAHPRELDSPNLSKQVSARKSYTASIRGEDRVDLNWLIMEAGIGGQENPKKHEFLDHYLENLGFGLNDRNGMIDCLLDWVDADNLERLNGAEEDADYHPQNRWPIPRIEELRKIKGWEGRDWENDFTVSKMDLGRGQMVPEQAKIDLKWASKDVLLALLATLGPGAEQAVDHFLELRPGEDGKDGTKDDAFKNFQEACTIGLGLPPQVCQEMTPLATFDIAAQLFRVKSTGTAGNVSRTIKFSMRRTGPVLYQLVQGSWKETASTR